MQSNNPSTTFIQNAEEESLAARKIVLSGQVQGVGFRPFIYRLATALQLKGWVRNCMGVVEIHVQGSPQNLQKFRSEIFSEKPAIAQPVMESEQLTTVDDFMDFNILPSQSSGQSNISVPVDLFLCDDCLMELYTPSDRRYHYPFINCTQCGPRYTLIQTLPYDRANTTMATFKLCPTCLEEYKDPNNRRFHAEPVACPVCGPSLSFHFSDTLVSETEKALLLAVETLRQGKVIAVKGIGGYHLMCDASNNDAVTRLRRNKPRPHKPLAVMFPYSVEAPFKNVDSAVILKNEDKAFLLEPARSILLVTKRKGSKLSVQIAPGLNEIGVMLPYSPLHHLLLNEFAGALVATSANISGEPVLTQNEEVEKRLSHVADACLHHNRPIERPADDAVFRTIADKPRPIRGGRGNTPLELRLPFKLQRPVLAVGTQMKNTIALGWENRVVISPHIGDMDSVRSLEVFQKSVNDLQHLYDVTAEVIIADAHPDYTTTRWANQQKIATAKVFHHHAHASAAYYECKTKQKVMLFSWDGVGYGEDNTLWGGETLVGKPGAWKRLASMRPFRLPGGNKAGRQPWRSAAALCWEIDQFYEEIPEKDPLLKQAWQQQINSPQTSSVGRLFDAAAALTGICTVASFEGQGPMLFEALSENLVKNHEAGDNAAFIPLELQQSHNLLICNWESLVKVMLDNRLSVTTRASIFHASLAQALLQQAKIIRHQQGVNIVSFSGGVFQNRVLTEYALVLLLENEFQVHLPELMPVNDAAISFGQIIEYGSQQLINQ